MAKFCPVCGERFPDHANVCDQHGVPLRRRVWHWWILGAALAAAPFSSLGAWSWQLRATIEGAQLEKGAAASAHGLPEWLVGKRLRVAVRITNDSVLPYAASGGAYELWLDGAKVAEGKLPANLELRRGSPVRVEAAVLVNGNLAARLLNPAGNEVTVRGETNVRVFGLGWRTPFERRVLLRASLAPDGPVHSPHH